MTNGTKVFVKTAYDRSFKERLWRAVIQDIESKRAQGAQYRPGDHFRRFVKPELDAHAQDIFRLPDEIQIALNFRIFDEDDPRQLRRYLTPDKENRGKPSVHFSDEVARVYHAYFEVTNPALAKSLAGERNTELLGETLASFLKDKSLFSSKYDLELVVNNFLGLYEYDEMDLTRKTTGLSRYFSLFESPAKEYLLALDFHWDIAEKSVLVTDEELDLYYGFVIPGSRFSTVLMRSLSFRYRQTGLLYTSKNLVEHEFGIVDEIIVDTMTTDEHILDTGENQSILDTIEDGDIQGFANLAAKSALTLTQGPRTSKTLKNISDQMRARAVQVRIGKFVLDNL